MPIPMERVENRILSIRGHRVILDADLAVLYGVTTGALNQAVKRNAERFPGDFMFRLTAEEGDYLKSQIVISRGIFDAIRALMEPPTKPRRRIGY